MDGRNILNKISSFSRRIRNTTKSLEDQLEDREDLYRDAIDSTDEMIRWLRHYKKDPDNPANSMSDSILPDYRLTSLNNAVSESPKIVSKHYNEYRETVPLLTGEETDFTRAYNSQFTEFKHRIKKHIKFVREMRSRFRDALDSVEDAQERLERQQYKKKAQDQRGDNHSIDKEQVMPEDSISEVSDEIYEIVADKIEEETEDESEEEDEEEDEDMRVMTTRQYVHYIIEHINVLRGTKSQPSEYHEILKDGFPEQSDVIDMHVNSIASLENIDSEKDGLIPLQGTEIKYIKKRVRDERKPDGTLEDFRDNYREKEVERIN